MTEYILEISAGCPSETYPLNGIFEFDQANALSCAGEKVVFAAVDLRSIRRWRKWGFYHHIKNGIEVYELNIPIGRISNTSLAKIASISLNRLYKKIERDHGKPKALHAHFGITIGYAAANLKNQIKKPLVITEHSSDLNKDEISKKETVLYFHAYQNADCVIAVSEHLRHRIKQHFGIDAKVIGNIVDTNFFKYVPKIKSNKFKFVSVGSLIHGKGFDVLIDSFYEGFKGNQNVELKIIGEGELRRDLQELINTYGLGGKIILLGQQDRHFIRDTFTNSDCFVLASRGETFGVVYIEAMATGTPVIATCCGGPEEFIGEKHGIVVRVDDKIALTNAMNYMVVHKNDYDAELIATDIKTKFSREVIASKLVDLFDNFGKTKERGGRSKHVTY